MSLSVIYGTRNVVYSVATGKITWNNSLAIVSKGGIDTPSSSDVLIRDDLGGQVEAMNSEGIPLPLDTAIVYRITTPGPSTIGEYHVYNIYDTGLVEDADNVILFVNKSGDISARNGFAYNQLDVSIDESKTYTDSSVRTDQEIIDVVTTAGVTISDYGQATAERIQKIIDETMKNGSIGDATDKLKESFEEYGLDGQGKAELASKFTLDLTKTVIQTAMQVGSQSMLTEKQGDLAVRQKEGFNDNLLVKANDSLAGTLGLVNSGTGNTIGSIVTRYDQTISDLINRSQKV